MFNSVRNWDKELSFWNDVDERVDFLTMDIDDGLTPILKQLIRDGRANEDEKHICPLQLDTIERIILLYSNKNETVFSPFGGIGSEGYQALKMNRNGIGIELKESYYNEAVKNCKSAMISKTQLSFL